ncbi:MAG: DUF624 domain-containing protein [Butyrivibrio sp.]|nr:DUF624 domain-containing protein [Butyrivibrio sp.]
MGKFFDLDSPLIRGLNKLADVMLLNVLVLIFAIPLIVEQFFLLSPVYVALMDTQSNFQFGEYIGVILIAWAGGIICSIPLGPALTAMHFVLLKIYRDEESYIAKTFFKAFKENFKQGAILQVLQFVVFGIIVLDFIMTSNMNSIFRYIVIAVGLILYMASLYIFPLQSKFENTILATLKNSFLVAIMALPKTVAMVMASLLPILLFYFFDLKLLPLLFLLGIAGPGFLCAALYSETFKKFEPKQEAVSEEEELEQAIRKIDDEEN